MITPILPHQVFLAFLLWKKLGKALKWDEDAGDDDVDVFMILLHTWICQKVFLLNSSPLNRHVGEYVWNFFKAYERRPGFRVIYQGLPRTWCPPYGKVWTHTKLFISFEDSNIGIGLGKSMGAQKSPMSHRGVL